MTLPIRSSVRRTPRGHRSLVGEILKGTKTNDTQIIYAVTCGLPTSALGELLAAGLEPTEIASVIGVSERTLHRKRERGARGSLRVAESDRAIRLARILADADRYIGDHGNALRWLRTTNWALGDRVPLDLLATEPGVEMVRQSLVSIAYGGVA